MGVKARYSRAVGLEASVCEDRDGRKKLVYGSAATRMRVNSRVFRGSVWKRVYGRTAMSVKASDAASVW